MRSGHTQHPFDFVLMDLAMPRCDGPQATRMFREWEAANLTPGHHLIILALSANVFEDMRIKTAPM
jgi:CheY-like chemotaxis protein